MAQSIQNLRNCGFGISLETVGSLALVVASLVEDGDEGEVCCVSGTEVIIRACLIIASLSQRTVFPISCKDCLSSSDTVIRLLVKISVYWTAMSSGISASEKNRGHETVLVCAIMDKTGGWWSQVHQKEQTLTQNEITGRPPNNLNIKKYKCGKYNKVCTPL